MRAERILSISTSLLSSPLAAPRRCPAPDTYRVGSPGSFSVRWVADVGQQLVSPQLPHEAYVTLKPRVDGGR